MTEKSGEMATHVWESDGFGSFKEKVYVVGVSKMQPTGFKLGLVQVENLPFLNDFGCKKGRQFGQGDTVPEVVLQLCRRRQRALDAHADPVLNSQNTQT